MSDLTPEVLEELTKALAAEEAAAAGKDDDEMYRTGSRLSNLLWTNAPALLAAAQRVQELELFFAATVPFLDWAQSYLNGKRLGHRLVDAIKAELLERDAEVAHLRAKVAELEGDRERLRGDADAVRALMDLYNLGGWTDTIAPMKRALAAEADLKAATEALDEWAPLLTSENKPLAERIRDEGKDFGMLCDHLSRTYSHFSDGRISKPNTLPSEVFAVAEDVQMRDFEEWMQDEPHPDKERLDWLDTERRRSWTRPPTRAIAGTIWDLIAPHGMGEQPTLRDAIDAARLAGKEEG